MYSPPNRKAWFGRIDQNEGNLGLRWHQKIRLINLQKEELPTLKKHENGIVFIGFKCDEGVRRNKGRVGAKDGPDGIRKASATFANHFVDHTYLFDAGDIICNDLDLEKAQSELEQLIKQIRSNNYFTFIFGGGHEMAFPHYLGLKDSLPKDKVIGIINIDAHFDLRIPEGEPSSGTPFYQISQICKKESHPFKYMCIGIQKSANTQALFKRADELGVEYICNNEINIHSISQHSDQIRHFVHQVDFVYLTICLDAFDISFAPGVSAPSAIGLHPSTAVEFIREIIKTDKLISADVAELNPRWDQDNKTSKLASKLVFEIIAAYQGYY